MYHTIVFIFYASIFLQILFWCYILFVFYPKTKRTVSSTSKQKEAISVVICAKNEAKNLLQNLPQILSQDYANYEVILVDDGSNDNTRSVINEFQKKHSFLKYIKVSESEKIGIGKKYALQRGILAATNPWIALTDADCQPASNQWLSFLSATIDKNKEIGLGYGGYINDGSLIHQIVQFDTIYTFVQYAGFANLGIPYMGVGRNLFYSKEVFIKNDGINDILSKTSGDDDLFINKTITKDNFELVINPSSQTLSSPSSSFIEYYCQKNRHYSVGGSYKIQHLLMLGLFNGTHFLSHLLFWTSLAYQFNLYLCIFYVLRLILATFSMFLIGTRYQSKTKFIYFFLLDVFWVFHYLIFSVSLSKGDVKKW